jgi:hypothetical protein
MSSTDNHESADQLALVGNDNTVKTEVVEEGCLDGKSGGWLMDRVRAGQRWSRVRSDKNGSGQV